ncbi:hypothetical protein [uncultured Ruminococcus sp.]|uniref:hypothetical protein n=1 Tax=uncultured Ruminococcus sp. TaxID=165186 RepID=UPI0025F43806|nr:hypothetical protein [uncultured Ruminococcus sp.]
MKLITQKCPACGANLEIEEGRDFSYCQYCGSKILIDNEKKEYTINKNINKNINKTIHKRYTDDAEVIKARNQEKEDKRSWIFLLVLFVFLICIIVVPTIVSNINKHIAQNEGKISAGYYGDLVGKDYKTVESHFKAAGFTNIQLIDLDDAGIAFWNNEKVDTISIGGDTSFNSSDWFSPDTKVVISYH